MKKIILTTLILLSGLSLLWCTSQEEELDASLVGPSDIVTGGAMIFKTGVDTQLTTSCATATAATDSSTTTSTESSSTTSSSSDSNKDITKYAISSYIQFESGETMLLKFTHDEDQESFRMIPSTSTAQTCPTTDFISCNGTTGVNPTCETTDNISCGGADSFIFTSSIPVATFEASSGTIDWTEGFTIDTTTGEVDLMDLEFDMLSTDGAVMSGTVRCRTI